MNAVQRGLQICGIASHIESFLTTQEQDEILRPLNIATISSAEAYASKLGELTVDEAAAKISCQKEYLKTKVIQSLKLKDGQMIVWQNGFCQVKEIGEYLNTGKAWTRCFKKLRYYSGRHHHQVSQCIVRMVEQRRAQAGTVIQNCPQNNAADA